MFLFEGLHGCTQCSILRGVTYTVFDINFVTCKTINIPAAAVVWCEGHTHPDDGMDMNIFSLGFLRGWLWGCRLMEDKD